MDKYNQQHSHDELAQLFKNEYATIKLTEKVLKDDNISKKELYKAYDKLAQQYASILQSFVKITKISDINQKKLYDSHQELEQQKLILYKAATTDQLTDIYNRAYLMDVLQTEHQRSQRFAEVFSCVMFDIDDFKKINDTYGHQMGDEVIKNIAAIAKKNIRSTDIVGRYGGEEFLIIMPNTYAKGAAVFAEKIRNIVAKTDFSNRKKRITCSISLGISDTTINSIKTHDDLLFNTDSALYHAKQTGKNNTKIFEPALMEDNSDCTTNRL
ncbi:MAG: GGDEF domain-containing protein [Pseudomonadota bacterium]